MSRSRALLLVVLLALVLGGLWWFVRARELELTARGDQARSSQDVAPTLADAPAPPPLDAAHAAPGRAALAQDEPAAVSGAFRGRLVDVRTRERVPWFDVLVRGSDERKFRCTSDAQGEFSTAGEVAAGGCLIQLADFAGQPSAPSSAAMHARVVHDPDAQPQEIAIPVGPTYSVQVEPPSEYGLDDFLVRLQLDPPEFGDAERGSRWPETRLRAAPARDGLPWVRFRDGSIDAGPSWLVLRSDDGLWRGGARVPGGYGVHAEPVHVVLEPRCAVTGRYVSRGAELDRGGANLALFRLAPDAPAPRWEFADGDGEFRIADLAPGDYRLEVRDEAARAAPVAFTLSGGELDLGELVWEPIPLAGPVRLKVISGAEVPIDVELVRLFDPPQFAPWHSDQWEEQPDGTFVSEFEWDEVYAGEFEIAVHSHDTTTWHVSLGRLTPPVEDLVLRLPTPAPPLQFEVLDSKTGAPLTDWAVIVRQERGWEELDGSPAALESMVWEPDAEVAVVSPGHKASVVRPAALQPSRDGKCRVTVHLEGGWSGLFLARTRMHGRPVAGAEVVLDGERAGVTDAAGELWVHLAAQPTTLEVRHPTLVFAGETKYDGAETVTWLTLRPR